MKKRKRSNKLLIIIILILIVSSIVVIKGKKSEKNTIIDTQNSTNNAEVDEKSTEKQESKKMRNASKEFYEERKLKNFKISDISFIENDEKVVLHATVTNTSGKDTKDYTYFKITFLNEDGKEIGTIPGIINPVKKNKTTELSASIRGKIDDYINAYDFKISVDKK